MPQGVDKNGIKSYQFHPVKSPLQNEFTILRPCRPQGICIFFSLGTKFSHHPSFFFFKEKLSIHSNLCACSCMMYNGYVCSLYCVEVKEQPQVSALAFHLI